MIKFLVIIAFTFHGHNGRMHIPVRAGNAEIATRDGFRAARMLACLYEGQVTRCVGPGSTAVTTSAGNDDGVCVEAGAPVVMFVRECGR